MGFSSLDSCGGALLWFDGLTTNAEGWAGSAAGPSSARHNRRMTRHRRRKYRPVSSRVAESGSAPVAVPRPSWTEQVDLRELATGAFVVAMLLAGSKLWPGLYTQASDLVVAQVMFEFPMAWLAVCAGQAIRHAARAMRITCVVLGVLVVALAGSVNALQMDAGWAIASGAWLLAARVAPPRGVEWFSAEHCRAIEITAGAAWTLLLCTFAVLMLGRAMTPPQPDGESAPAFVYAIGWGAYYLSLGCVLPHVRRRFSRPRANTSARVRSR